MKYTGKWYQKVFRYIQVKWFVLTKRYRPVPNGVNFYADMKHNGVGVKGYYWKPMTHTTPMISIDNDIESVEIQFVNGEINIDVKRSPTE